MIETVLVKTPERRNTLDRTLDITTLTKKLTQEGTPSMDFENDYIRQGTIAPALDFNQYSHRFQIIKMQDGEKSAASNELVSSIEKDTAEERLVSSQAKHPTRLRQSRASEDFHNKIKTETLASKQA